jgi:hypothetical protein
VVTLVQFQGGVAEFQEQTLVAPDRLCDLRVHFCFLAGGRKPNSVYTISPPGDASLWRFSNLPAGSGSPSSLSATRPSRDRGAFCLKDGAQRPIRRATGSVAYAYDLSDGGGVCDGFQEEVGYIGS